MNVSVFFKHRQQHQTLLWQQQTCLETITIPQPKLAKCEKGNGVRTNLQTMTCSRSGTAIPTIPTEPERSTCELCLYNRWVSPVPNKNAKLTRRWKWVHSEYQRSKQRHTYSKHHFKRVLRSHTSNCCYQFWQQNVSWVSFCVSPSLCVCV